MASASSGGALQTRAGTTTGRKREAAGIRQLHQDPKSSFKQEIYQSRCFIFTSPGTAEQRQYRETSVLPQPSPRVPAAGPFWLPGFPCCVGHRGSPRRWPGPGSQPCFPFRKRKQRSSGKVYFKRRLFGRHRNSAEGRGLILSCPVPLQQGVPKPGSGIIDSSPITTYWEVSRSKNSSRSVLTKHPCRDGGGQGWGQAGAQQWGHKLNSRGGVWREL